MGAIVQLSRLYSRKRTEEGNCPQANLKLYWGKLEVGKLVS